MSLGGGLRPGRMGHCQGRDGAKGWSKLGKELAQKGCLPHKARSLHLENIQERRLVSGTRSQEAETQAGQAECGSIPALRGFTPEATEVAGAGR